MKTFTLSTVALTLSSLLALLLPSAHAQFVGYGTDVRGAPALEAIADLRFSPSDETVVRALREDLQVLARVVERLARPDSGSRATTVRMGIPMLLSPPDTAVRATYLEGFGVLLTLDVDLSLTAPATTAASAKPDERKSEWEVARRELAGETDAAESGAAFDPARLQQLKETLVTALRQATNVQHLAKSDVVAIAVRGPAASSRPAAARELGLGPGSASVTETRYVNGVGYASFGVSGAGGGGTGESAGVRRSWGTSHGGYGSGTGEPDAGESVSYLTLRVRKADVDALAGGALSPEAFAQKVDVLTYESRSDPPRPRENTRAIRGSR